MEMKMSVTLRDRNKAQWVKEQTGVKDIIADIRKKN